MNPAPSPAPRRSPLALAVLSLLIHEPLHPYGVQRLLKQWGKEAVVNVGQRATLYKTMDRLLAEGLIAVQETRRDQQYPERTTYRLTDEGRVVARRWMGEMLATPKVEYPEFPAALSFVPMLSPPELLGLLKRRHAMLAATAVEHEARIAASVSVCLPGAVLLDDEYLRDLNAAELRWVTRTIDELQSNRLTWNTHELFAAARSVESR